jgi:hypothetical protein
MFLTIVPPSLPFGLMRIVPKTDLNHRNGQDVFKRIFFPSSIAPLSA